MFITLEGIEGSGKTTQIEGIAGFFRDRGHDCLLTREPGGTRIGRRIRGILLDPKNEDLVPAAELLLYMADRVQHVRSVILPAIARGEVVICDRYMDATLVYQGCARGLDMGMIRDLYRMIIGDVKPDLTFLLDLPPVIGLARAWKQIDGGERTGEEARFEKEALGFHEKIRTGYLDLARLEPERFHVINAGQSPDRVCRAILAVLSESLDGEP